MLRLILPALALPLLTMPPAHGQEWLEFIPSYDTPEVFALDSKEVTSGVPRIDLVNFVLDAEVKSIPDGDTIVLTGVGDARFTIRMSDYDTPETSHRARVDNDCACNSLPFRPGQRGGRAATEALKELISVGEQVEAQCYEMDRYGRAVCHIFANGKNVNLKMIESGWGWLPSNTNWVRDPDSAAAQAAAEDADLGAWGLPGQVSPREWRTECWREGNCAGAENWPHKQ